MKEEEYKKAQEIINSYGFNINTTISIDKIEKFLNTKETIIELLEKYLQMWKSRPFKSKPVMDKKGKMYLIRSYSTDVKDNETFYQSVEVIDRDGNKTKMLVTDLVDYSPTSEVLFGSDKKEG